MSMTFELSDSVIVLHMKPIEVPTISRILSVLLLFSPSLSDSSTRHSFGTWVRLGKVRLVNATVGDESTLGSTWIRSARADVVIWTNNTTIQHHRGTMCQPFRIHHKHNWSTTTRPCDYTCSYSNAISRVRGGLSELCRLSITTTATSIVHKIN